jgi:nitrate reductase NapD
MNHMNHPQAFAISIAGVLLHAVPDRAGEVRAQLEQLPGVEIHAVTPEGKMVVTVDESGERMSGENVMRLYEIDGVLSAAIIYHQYENNAAAQETSE